MTTVYFGDTLVDSIYAGETPLSALYRGGALVWSGEPVTLNQAFALGDSTVAAFAGGTAIMDLISSSRNKNSLADPGDTINQQLAVWNSAPNRGLAGWVIIQIGLNDLDPAEVAFDAIVRIQNLVNAVNAAVPTATAVLVSKMIPVRQRLINVYGAIDGPVAYQKWLDMNEAIAGAGPTPITGVDGRVTAHEPLMNDGAGNLLAIYDTGDGIHPNTAGRTVNAQAWVDALVALGVTV